MRGPSISPPKYRKHKASGQAIVTLNGKDHYLGPHGTKASQQLYDQLVGEWLANGRNKFQGNDHDSITVAQLAAEYWKFAKGYYVKNGRPTDELPGLKIAIRHLIENYAQTPVDHFGPLCLANIQQQFVAAGHCRRYINQNTGRIKRMFKWGVARELVPVKTYQAISTVSGLRKGKTAARESTPILPVSDEDVEKTIANLRNSVTADMVRIQSLTGCRPGELFIMRPCDIDRSGAEHIGVWLYYPESHKMEHKERHRVIVIGPNAQSILCKYLLRNEKQLCFLRTGGKPYKRWHYAQHIAWACDKAGTDRWAPNQLRHAAGTRIRAKYGLEAGQVILGHANADVTQIYAERDLAKAIQIMQEVG